MIPDEAVEGARVSLGVTRRGDLESSGDILVSNGQGPCLAMPHVDEAEYEAAVSELVAEATGRHK